MALLVGMCAVYLSAIAYEIVFNFAIVIRRNKSVFYSVKNGQHLLLKFLFGLSAEFITTKSLQ